MNTHVAMGRTRWWQWLVPLSLLRGDVQVLLLSRLLSELGMATLSYGAMVHVARIGASQLEVTFLSTAGAIAALIFGLSGGALADSLSKRVALVGAYGMQAVLCIVIPLTLGTDFVSLLLLVFSVRLLTQVVAPAVKAAVYLIASATEIGVAVMLLTMAGGIGSGVGTAVLAPTLIKLFEIRVLLFIVGGIMVLAAIRTLRLPGDRNEIPRAGEEAKPQAERLTLLSAGSWLLSHPALASIIMSGAIVAILNDVFESLQPIFVRDTLNTDPANSVYVFAPGLIGTILAVVLSPLLIRWPGERWLINIALFSFAGALVLLGLIHYVGPYLAPFSPLHLLAPFGLNFSQLVLAAGLVGVPVKFGAGAANTAVQAYINRRVPYGEQGSAFGMLTVLQNGFGVGASFIFGAAANQFGTPIVFVCAPVLIVALISYLIHRGTRTRPEGGPKGGAPQLNVAPGR